MNESLRVIDNFCPQIEEVRTSALESGFGKWTPNKGEVGSSIYEGMNFWGRHSYMLAALSAAIGGAPIPNNIFFRVTNTGTESAYVHSDRMWGARTCIAYLSNHDGIDSGTAFYRHRETGLTEMPTFGEMKEKGIFDLLKKDMVEGGEHQWENIDFVKGLYNRALVFNAPLFHSRYPKTGIGSDSASGRMVWVCHFCLIGNDGKLYGNPTVKTGGAAVEAAVR